MARQFTPEELQALMIFVKNPEPGKVKTRLAQEIGEKPAASVYEKLLAMTKVAADGIACHKKVYYQDYKGQQDLWDDGNYEKVLQKGAELGEKMMNAFRENLQNFEKVLIIGSDCPEISADLMQTAFNLLDDHDAVLGPAEDGGYYLLGLKTFDPDLFNNKSWSTDQVLTETLETLKAKGIQYSLLPVLNDIDDYEDLENSILNLPVSNGGETS